MLDPAPRRIKNPRSPFSWSREISHFDASVVIYRLHRNNDSISWGFDVDERRSVVAQRLKWLRKELRGQ